MQEKDYYDELKEYALTQGASLFGAADISGLPERQCSLPAKTLKGLDKAVSIAFHLSDRVLEDIVDGPTRLYFFHYQRANMLLDEMGLKIMNFIQDRGWDALPFPFPLPRSSIGKSNGPRSPTNTSPPGRGSAGSAGTTSW
jgi:hypothetical protein